MKDIQNITFNSLICELENFEELLEDEDKATYRQILRKPLQNLSNINSNHNLNNPNLNNSKNILQSWIFLILNIMMEHEKKLGTIEDLYKGISAGYIEKPSIKLTVDQL